MIINNFYNNTNFQGSHTLYDQWICTYIICLLIHSFIHSFDLIKYCILELDITTKMYSLLNVVIYITFEIVFISMIFNSINHTFKIPV